MNKNANKKQLEQVFTIWGLVLILWSLYRAKLHLPELVDEFLFKPLVFAAPIAWYVKTQEQKPLSSIGWAKGKLWRDLALGIGIGLLFLFEASIVNAFKYGKLSQYPALSIFGVGWVTTLAALAASLSEETLARGFFYTRLKEGYGSEFKAMLVSTGMYFLLLVPVIFTTTKLAGTILLVFVFTNVIMSLANIMIFNKTKTLTIPVLIHAFWNLSLLMY